MVQNDLWPKSKLQFLIVILFERKESRKRSCPAVVYDQTITYGNRRNSLEPNDARRLAGRRRIVHQFFQNKVRFCKNDFLSYFSLDNSRYLLANRFRGQLTQSKPVQPQRYTVYHIPKEIYSKISGLILKSVLLCPQIQGQYRPSYPQLKTDQRSFEFGRAKVEF